MHIWGFITLHPLTFPIADQVMSTAAMAGRYSLTVYGAVLKPSVEDFKFLFEHL